MPGQTPTELDQYADEIVRMRLPQFSGTDQNVLIGVVDRDCWLEHVTYSYGVAAGAPRTATIAKVAAGVDIATSTDLTAAAAIDLNGAVDTAVTIKGSPTTSEVKAGERIILAANAAIEAALDELVVECVFTTRRK